MNGYKITGLAAGTLLGDALAHSQSGAVLAGLMLTAALAMGGNEATNLAAPTASTSAARLAEVQYLFSKTWYVSAGAAPGGNGSCAAPFQTVQAGLNAAAAGDVVYVGPGVYAEAITWPNVDNITL